MHGWLHNLGWAGLFRALRSGADIFVVWYLIYRLMMLAKGTRAWQIITGLLVFLAVLALSSWAQLSALTWILKQMFVLGPLAIVILFYPELRHTLEEVGRLGFWGKGFAGLDRENLSQMVSELVRTADQLSDKKIGALIVLERETGLSDIIETGTVINADVNAELLATIFYPGSPLHDGAVVIRRNRIVAAGCTLPLSESRDIAAQQVHTRHKAALGISEQSDALVLVVSEETGIVSLMLAGKMRRGRRADVLRQDLMGAFKGQERTVVRRRRSLRMPSVATAPHGSLPSVSVADPLEEDAVAASEPQPPDMETPPISARC